MCKYANTDIVVNMDVLYNSISTPLAKNKAVISAVVCFVVRNFKFFLCVMGVKRVFSVVVKCMAGDDAVQCSITIVTEIHSVNL